MHTRKAAMFDEADAFIAIPGGLGTLDETLEICTWQQLGLHAKPIGLLNIDGFFDGLLQFLDHATEEVCACLIVWDFYTFVLFRHLICLHTLRFESVELRICRDLFGLLVEQ
jgi:hypothetical protein